MVMLGEVKYGHELGYKTSHGQFIYAGCLDCGQTRWVLLDHKKPKNLRCKACANRLHSPKGKDNARWAGGKSVRRDGYVAIKVYPDSFYFPMADHHGYVLESRLVMAQHLGRCLQTWEWVHHKNGKKDNNRLDNLELTTMGSHIIEHSKGYRDGYTKGLTDGRLKQIEELKDLITEQGRQIKLLEWQLKQQKVI